MNIRFVIVVVFLFDLSSSLMAFGCNFKSEYGTVEARENKYGELVGFIDTDQFEYDDDYVLGIAIHVIDECISDEKINEHIEILKNGFNPGKIDFYVVYKDAIENTIGAYDTDTIVGKDELAGDYNIDNVINVYYVPDLEARGISTFSDKQQTWYNEIYEIDCNRTKQSIFIRGSNKSTTTLAHEMGHFFDLFHVYEEIFFGPGNSWSDGDLLMDTPQALETDNYDCVNTDILSRNFMRASIPEYDEGDDCRSKFSYQQFGRMRYTIKNYRADYLFDTITVANIINQQNSLGQLMVYQGALSQTVESGDEAALLRGTNAGVRTLQERVYNWNGSSEDYKHHHWNSDKTKFKLSKTISPGELGIHNAQLTKIVPATVSIEVQPYLENPDISLEILDPWHVHENGVQEDDYYSISVYPFNITGHYNETEGGVFLDQGDLANLQPPYYSVNAPEVQTLTVHGDQEILVYFRNWSATDADLQHPEQNETPVIFRQPNASVTANYKGHMASGNERASGYNNGRVLTKTSDGTLHLVYEDNNEIYYAASTDNGGEWTDEVELSTGNDNINPSIASLGNSVFVTWGIGDHEIWFRQKKENDLSQYNLFVHKI